MSRVVPRCAGCESSVRKDGYVDVDNGDVYCSGCGKAILEFGTGGIKLRAESS